ncbi:MAG: hypothetical protein U9R15_02325 [Chloroflexota bacterium]|nr:hypothetical protein [Chloroflexota bacterium]
MLANKTTTSRRQAVKKARSLITGALKNQFRLLNGQLSISEIVPHFRMLAWLIVSRFGLPDHLAQDDRRIAVIVSFQKVGGRNQVFSEKPGFSSAKPGRE